jgi:hypothetical protein
MNVTQEIGGFITPYDHEVITVSTTPIGFTLAKLVPQGDANQRDQGPARVLLVTMDSANSLRYTTDGSTPVATSHGHVLLTGQALTLGNFQAMKSFRAVREGGADSKLQVTFLR